MIKNGYNTIHILEMNDGKFPFNNQKDFIDKNPDEPFSSRFFVAVIDKNSNIVSVNTDKIFAISENEAKDITISLFNKNKVKGLYTNYLYRRQKINDTEYRYIFLDMAIQINYSKMFLFTSIIVSLISLALICIVFLFLAKLVIKPIEKNAIKQKQFITDATHEIKTPLTIIGADVEVLELINGENEWTNSVKNQTNRLSVMTKRLTYLAKAEENTNMTFSDVSLNNAINEVISSFSSILKTNNKDIVINDIEINDGYIDATVSNGDTDTIDSNGTIKITGGVVLKNGQNNGQSMTGGTFDCEGSIIVTSGTIIAIGCVGEKLSNAYINTQATLQVGSYTIKDSNNNEIATFTLTQSYRGFMFYDKSFNGNTTYTLYKDDTKVLTFSK